LIFRHSFFLDEKRSKKIKTSEKQLEIYRLFSPQTRRAPLMPKFNNLLYARWRLLSARPSLKIAFDLLRCFSKVLPKRLC